MFAYILIFALVAYGVASIAFRVIAKYKAIEKEVIEEELENNSSNTDCDNSPVKKTRKEKKQEKKALRREKIANRRFFNIDDRLRNISHNK